MKEGRKACTFHSVVPSNIVDRLGFEGSSIPAAGMSCGFRNLDSAFRILHSAFGLPLEPFLQKVSRRLEGEMV